MPKSSILTDIPHVGMLAVKVLFVPNGITPMRYLASLPSSGFNIPNFLEAGMNPADVFAIAQMNYAIYNETLATDSYMKGHANSFFVFTDIKNNPDILNVVTDKTLLGSRISDKPTYGKGVKRDHFITEDLYKHLSVHLVNDVLVLQEVDDEVNGCEHVYLEKCLDLISRQIPVKSLLASSLFKVFSSQATYSPKQMEELGYAQGNVEVDFRTSV